MYLAILEGLIRICQNFEHTLLIIYRICAANESVLKIMKLEMNSFFKNAT